MLCDLAQVAWLQFAVAGRTEHQANFATSRHLTVRSTAVTVAMTNRRGRSVEIQQ